MSTLINFIKPIDVTGYTLIIPSVSVGNVPQLTADLAISTHEMKKLATVWHPAIIPSVGADPFNEKSIDICTACEMFGSENLKIAVIQIRSGLDGKYSSKFLEELKENIKTLKFKNVFLLTSSFAHEMHDVNSSKYRFMSNDVSKDAFDAINVTELQSDVEIGGLGFAFKFYKALLADGIKSTLLMLYCSEGDNRPDAIEMLQLLYKIILAFENQGTSLNFKAPVSWINVYGNAPPIGIY